MTRQFNQQVHCPNCNTWITHETSFGRWIRNNKELDSKIGYSVIDQDYWIHQYKRHQSREFQCIMGIEIKTFGMELTDSQRDTLHIINQLMRNRRQVNLNYQAGSGTTALGKSTLTGKNIILRAYGMHVLTFSHLGPYDSEWISWDKKRINIKILTKILRFDLDPDTLRKLDLRLHHKNTVIEIEEKVPLGFSIRSEFIKKS